MNAQPAAPAALTDRLAAIEQARQACLQARDPAAGPPMAPWLLRSWSRCLTLGMEPGHPVVFEAVSASETRLALDASQPLLQAAAPVIRSLVRAMAHTRYFAILTDARGRVIDVNGPIDPHDRRATQIARVGVDLSEQAVGTTAIGACLNELAPVGLHRGEHFFRDTSVYSCAGAPILGPDGQCAGMLDLTGVEVQEQPALRHLVAQSARAIENALVLAQPHALLLRLNWPGHLPGDESDGLLSLDSDGLITGANRPAAEMLGLPPGGPAGHASRYIATPVESLFDAAQQQRAATEVPLWSGLRLLVLAQASRTPGPRTHNPAGRHGVSIKDMEAALIRKAVDDAQGNLVEAARALGISRATLYRKLGARKR